MTPLRTFDRWLLSAGSAHRLATVRSALAAVIGIRIALGPFGDLQPPPDGLFRPPPLLSWLGAIPGDRWITAVQLLGIGGAAAAAAGRRTRAAFAVAWLCLLLLAGLKGSYGKVLHNDVLLLLAAVPMLAAPPRARRGDHAVSSRFGWPVQAAVAVVALVYLVAGVQKLRHSGPAWVAGDNMRWVLYQAAEGGRMRWPGIPRALAGRAWFPHVLAAGLLIGELLAPALVLNRRTRSLFAAYAVALHAGTWLLLGLDYWAWALTAVAVLVASAVPEPAALDSRASEVRLWRTPLSRAWRGR